MPSFQPFDIVVFKGKPYNLIHKLIQWRSLSDATHTAIIQNPDYIVEADTSGVHSGVNLSKYKGRDIEVYRYCKQFDANKLNQWLQITISEATGYDFLAWIGFTLGIEKLQDDNAWYCSELCYWLFQDNDCQLTRKDLDFIYPSFFQYSNEFKLVYEGTL